MIKLNFLLHHIYFIFFYIFFKKKEKKFINKKTDIVSIRDEYEVLIPKKFWIFWYDLDMPELISCCVENIRNLHPEYEVNILNKKTVLNYINLDIEKLIDIMPIANLSDLVRLKLLKKYGGIWMDASIILEKNIEEFFLLKKNTFDILGFYNSYQSKNINLPVLESWFLAAPPNSKFIEKWLYYFEPISYLGNEGLFSNFKKYNNFKELCEGLGNPLYLVVYIAAKLAYKDMKGECNMKFYCCDDSAFSIQIYSKWRTRKCTANFYIRDKFIFSPIYKLTSGDRKYYSFLRKNNLINKKSIIGLFLGSMKND